VHLLVSEQYVEDCNKRIIK